MKERALMNSVFKSGTKRFNDTLSFNYS